VTSSLRGHWDLDPAITFLNHGSFGACPRVVLDAQSAIRARLEREPVRFMVRELEPLWDAARTALARFVGASAEGLAFVPNATTGVNAVLRSLVFEPGDELLTTSHEYNACRNALEFVAARAGAKVVVADIPFPIDHEDQVVDAILSLVTPRTRLFLVDHVTSPTALVMPVARLAGDMARRGVEVLVDGAHAPGMIPLEVEATGATYYTGNCHKWICAPKGAAFLWVAENRRGEIRPTVISHGANSPRVDRSRFHLEFDWQGTFDPSPMLAVPEAMRFVESLHPDGWAGVMRHNRELALAGRAVLCQALGIDPPAPESMIGSIASVPLPDGSSEAAPSLYGDPIQDRLLFECGIEVPVVPWPAPPNRLLRISAQLYNEAGEYRRLARELTRFLEDER
jgi:isopenicillin-N epimerase